MCCEKVTKLAGKVVEDETLGDYHKVLVMLVAGTERKPADGFATGKPCVVVTRPLVEHVIGVEYGRRGVLASNFDVAVEDLVCRAEESSREKVDVQVIVLKEADSQKCFLQATDTSAALRKRFLRSETAFTTLARLLSAKTGQGSTWCSISMMSRDRDSTRPEKTWNQSIFLGDRTWN